MIPSHWRLMQPPRRTRVGLDAEVIFTSATKGNSSLLAADATDAAKISIYAVESGSG
jgi:hypothetical protein